MREESSMGRWTRGVGDDRLTQPTRQETAIWSLQPGEDGRSQTMQAGGHGGARPPGSVGRRVRLMSCTNGSRDLEPGGRQGAVPSVMSKGRKGCVLR